MQSSFGSCFQACFNKPHKSYKEYCHAYPRQNKLHIYIYISIYMKLQGNLFTYAQKQCKRITSITWINIYIYIYRYVICFR